VALVGFKMYSHYGLVGTTENCQDWKSFPGFGLLHECGVWVETATPKHWSKATWERLQIATESCLLHKLYIMKLKVN